MKPSHSWTARIERAEQLQEEHEAAAELLGFYASLLRLQQSIYQDMISTGRAEIVHLAHYAPSLLHLVETSAPQAMAELAHGLHQTKWETVLATQWSAQRNNQTITADFFVCALLQPYAEILSRDTPAVDGPRCPYCNSLPHLAVMRPEGEGARRFLYCGFCAAEWGYRRLKCVNCGEEDKERLPSFKSGKFGHIYLAGCENCHTTLKCIDLGVDGHAVPAVDDIASVSLSLWAHEEGYRPVSPNLFGF